MSWLCERRAHRAARRLGLAVTLLTALVPAAARAHDESVSTSDVVVTQREIIWKVDVGLAGLAKVVKLPVAETAMDEAALASVRNEIARYLASGLQLRVDGQPLTAEPGRLEPRYETLPETGAPGIARVELALHHRSPRDIQRVEANFHFFSDLTAQHRALVKVTWGADRRQYTRLGTAQLLLERGQLFPSTWNTAREFLLWGGEHIFLGFDHIAFLIALLLAITSLKELIKVVTGFTVAHSATLLLAALNVVHVPSRLTEALIAASIVYVAAENLAWGDRTARYRWVITFGFGLVHGLGFATQLRERLAEVPGGIVLPVLTFNLGVELGQLAIVCLVFPLLTFARQGQPERVRLARHRAVMRMGSVPILLLGLFWLVERLSG